MNHKTPKISVAGIDGAPGGWAVCAGLVQPDRTIVVTSLRFADDLADVVRAVDQRRLHAVAIDMPIGLLDTRPRVCDTEARKLLGVRRSSVFPAPARSTLGAATFDEARVRSKATLGKSLTIQAYNLLPKVAELDALLTTPLRRGRIVEAHPELAFQRLNDDQPLEDPKARAAGRIQRRKLLKGSLGTQLDTALADRPVPEADALDSLALLITATHLAEGTERRLGNERDQLDRPVQIVF